MFVRKKRNRSGSVSVHIVEKKNGRYRIVHVVGCSSNEKEITCLYEEAHHMIPRIMNQRSLGFMTEPDRIISNFFQGIGKLDIRVIGPELILGPVFDRIGFNSIQSELFRDIVIARLAYPTSKLKTVDYLERYKGIHIDISKLYRFMDELHRSYKNQAEDIAYRHTKNVLGESISVVFYDMTTLYFEAEDEDDLRKIGFSKDGKFQNPQIMLGLLVGKEGLPIGYDIFEGNTFEGHTLLPTLEAIQKKYGFGKPVVVADAALLSNENIRSLAEENYCFIIGGRIRNESMEIQKQILEQARGMQDRDSFVIKKPDRTRLVVTYSDKRAKKDLNNRERGLRKLRQRVNTGRLTKENISNRGYNKFLVLKGDIKVSIYDAKVEEDALWDGLKGYVTNSRFPIKSVVENYAQLWQIEKAFRISKTDLRVRPIHHYRKRRIEAHVCIAFVAYAIYKELERQLAKHKIKISAKRAIELSQTIYELRYVLPDSQEHESVILKQTKEQDDLLRIVSKTSK